MANIRRYTNTCTKHKLVLWLIGQLWCWKTKKKIRVDRRKYFYMLLEKLFLSFRLVEKQISGPVSGRQSSESFLQVVMFLEALDELLQLLLSSLNWSKSAGTHQWSKRKQTQMWKSYSKIRASVNANKMLLYDCEKASEVWIPLTYLLTWCSFCVFENPGMDPGWGSWSDRHSHTTPWQSFLRRAHSASLPPDWLH